MKGATEGGHPVRPPHSPARPRPLHPPPDHLLARPFHQPAPDRLPPAHPPRVPQVSALPEEVPPPPPSARRFAGDLTARRVAPVRSASAGQPPASGAARVGPSQDRASA